MLEPRLQIKFKPNSQNALNQVKNLVENRIVSVGIVVRHRDFNWVGTVQDGVALSLRIPVQLQAEGLIDYIRDNISYLASRGKGVVNFHLCTHGESSHTDCRSDSNTFYREHKF